MQYKSCRILVSLQLMLRRYNIFISLLLLAVFCYPLVQIEVHAFEHRNDTHCDATAEVHLHELEHVCSICDFSVSFSEGAVATYFNVIEVINSGTWFTASVPVVPSTAWPFLPPRAPPV